MRVNTLKRKLLAGTPCIGSFVYLPSAKLTEIVGHCGYDFMVVDCEHGSIDTETVEDMVRASELTDVPLLVRVSHNSPEQILKALDTGSMGIHVPEVDTVEEAQRAAQASRYAPIGSRGLGRGRASRYGFGLSLPDYCEIANAETLVVAHIESAHSIDNLDALLEVDGIDVYYLGPVDLSNSLGIPGRTSEPAVVERVESAIKRIVAAGKIAGCIAGDVKGAKRYIDLGALYIATHAMQEMITGAQRFLGEVRA